MKESAPNEMKLTELAQATGVPARTIRLYIARGLLQRPLRLGRGALYGEQHVRRLKKIRKLQSQGLTLKEIAHALMNDQTNVTLPPPQSCWRYALTEDVVVSVRADVSPWRRRQIHKALTRLASELAKPKEENQNDEHCS